MKGGCNVVVPDCPSGGGSYGSDISGSHRLGGTLCIFFITLSASLYCRLNINQPATKSFAKIDIQSHAPTWGGLADKSREWAKGG